MELYLLLADNLAVKHSWKLEEFMSDIADSPTTELSVEKTSLDEVGGVYPYASVEWCVCVHSKRLC